MNVYKYKLSIYFGCQYGTLEVFARNLADAIKKAKDLCPTAVEIKLATY